MKPSNTPTDLPRKARLLTQLAFLTKDGWTASKEHIDKVEKDILEALDEVKAPLKPWPTDDDLRTKLSSMVSPYKSSYDNGAAREAAFEIYYWLTQHARPEIPPSVREALKKARKTAFEGSDTREYIEKALRDLDAMEGR